ncbi:1,2-phenylacetyl-CoA epoxidase subunit PaaC [Acidocella aromatica]|uniref:Ring-1,2-phenylacetyl-CoA epoxidase subunit PaaC n=1 Tax=Acidocella aromatica TaxID=1303579 RepID=A0A840VLC5_9PROT|nr:1,2-phenylacetyl-CoA epoxidase subunit PaaC [Acidocella aromatica]MBB5373009.1 ring-1,2-phenylacetyl-CoA epoxidase subunit PaaC [Acidocella aromatica]
MSQTFTLSPAELALRLGDDALILSHRLCEWCGHAPTLEVDLALSNIGLDLLGQAQFFLNYAGEMENAGRDADALAYHRDEHEFKNCLLTEQPNGDFARSIVRQFFFSAWQQLRFHELAKSGDATMAAIATKALKEIAYHVQFAAEWVVRLGDGTEESKCRVADGISWSWRFVDELFTGEDAALRPAWEARVRATLNEAGLDLPAPVRGITGGREGRHSEYLGHLLAEMQYVQRCHPNAQW